MLNCIGKQHVPLGCLKSHKRFVNQLCVVCYLFVIFLFYLMLSVLDDINGNMVCFLLLEACLVLLS